MNKEPEFRKIHIDQLTLDSHNPRLPKSMHGDSEDKIIEFMLLEAATLELMQAIGENDFFIGEQLLVVEEDDDKYCVVEGNRRLVAVKLLNTPELASVQKNKVERVVSEAQFKPTEIPCLVFDQKDEIIRYLGFRHITGIKSWKLLEKARYLHQLRYKLFPDSPFRESARELAKMIGSRKDYVQRILAGFEIYQKIEDLAFYKIRGLDDTTFHFNYIADSLNRSHIADYLGVDFSNETLSPTAKLNLENIKKWTHWLFEKNDQNKTRLIGTSGDLNKLNRILQDEKAREAFEERGKSLDRAYELTEDIDEIFASAIKKSLDYLEQADSLTHKVSRFYSGVSDDLTSIRKLTSKIKFSKENLDEDEF